MLEINYQPGLHGQRVHREGSIRTAKKESSLIMGENEEIAIEFLAEVRALKTMADLTVNLTFNVPEQYKVAALQKFGKWQGQMVHIIAVLED
jgi:hypothetical protein